MMNLKSVTTSVTSLGNTQPFTVNQVCMTSFTERINFASTADCKDKIRLVGGSTNREGRVEVCMDGRWGTVCNKSQKGIAGAVCTRLGFPVEGLS